MLQPDDIPSLGGGLHVFAEAAFRHAWEGMPIAVVFELERRA